MPNLQRIREKIVETLALLFHEEIVVSFDGSRLVINECVITIGKTIERVKCWPGVTIRGDEVPCYILDGSKYFIHDKDIVDKVAHITLQRKLDNIK